MLELRSNIVRRAALASLVALCSVACGGGESGGDRGKACEVENVRVELVHDYRPPSGRPIAFPADLKTWKLEGGSGELAAPKPGEPGQPALRMKITDKCALTMPGPHDLQRLESLTFIAWVIPKRVIQAAVRARSGEQVWSGSSVGPALEGEGWQLFRVPLPPDAVQAGNADELRLEFSGDVIGDLAIEAPVLEWVVAPPWKALFDGDLAKPRSIQLSNGTRSGYALAYGRVLRAQAKMTADGGHIAFAHSTIEPARGKPTLGYFVTTIQHADGRVGQIRTKIETRNKWFDDKPVAFQGKAGETIQIAIELVVEGPGSLCAAISDLEVTAP